MLPSWLGSPGRIGPGLIEAALLPSAASVPSPDLPGESARASLKRKLHGPSVSAIRLSPGRIGPGLIEAGPRAATWTTPLRTSPGRIGPGLIEAAVLYRQGPRLATSPGRIGPGLIEAMHRAFPRSPGRTSSPGRIGPGLIEAAPPTSAESGTRPYLPGESARASLKHDFRRPVAAGPVTSPGRIGPGLIEARASGSGSTGWSPISRANRPGPH